MNPIQQRILDGLNFLKNLGAAEAVTITKTNRTNFDPVAETSTEVVTMADTVVTMHTVDADEQAESLATNQEIIFIVAIGPLDDSSFILEIDDVITTVSLYGGGDFRISDFILGDGANAQKEVRCYKEGSVSN